jgi:DNA polymerase III alpha subunit
MDLAVEPIAERILELPQQFPEPLLVATESEPVEQRSDARRRRDEGWKNMLKVNHDAVRNGYYYKPRTTHDFVCSNAAGLVATTTCIGSLFNRLALRGDEQGLGKLLRQFKDAFGDRFYREVHLNELPDQKKAMTLTTSASVAYVR